MVDKDLGPDPAGIDPEKLDFTRFHDLMHWPFGPVCFGQYGGPLRHVRLWLAHVAWPAVARQTLCRVGRHQWGPAWRRDQGNFTACGHCWKQKP